MDEVDDGKGRRVWFFFGFVFIKQRVRAVHSKASSGENFKPSAPDHPNGFPKACTRLYYKKYIYTPKGLIGPLPLRALHAH